MADTSPDSLALLRAARYYAFPYPGYPCRLPSPRPLNTLIEREQPDVVIFHQDIFTFQDLGSPFAARTLCCLPLHYTPIETNTRVAMRLFDGFVALSEFGGALINQEFPTRPCFQIPLCFDETLYRGRADDAERRRIREHFGLPRDRFVCLLIGANFEHADRKAFGVQIDAFAALLRDEPDAFLYLHTQAHGALDLPALLARAGVPGSAFAFVDQQRQRNNDFLARDIADLYHACDVLLFASKSEGFGLPIIEAQAAGCPVITTNFASMPELTFNGICTAFSEREYRAGSDSYWARPDRDAVARALLDIRRRDPATAERLRALGVEQTRNFTARAVRERWRRCLESFTAR